MIIGLERKVITTMTIITMINDDDDTRAMIIVMR